MPISNLTNAPKAFMRLGMIKKGEMKEFTRQDGSKGTKPVDLDYFRVTFSVGKLQPDIEAAFHAAYGEKPQELNVRFADAAIGEIWDANYECYKQGGLVAKAGSNEQGAYWIFYRDPDSSEVLVRNGSAVGAAGRDFIEKPLDLESPIYKNSKGEPILLEPVGRLQVVIPEVAHLAVGYFEFQPKSPRDIRNISAELGMYAALAAQYNNSITGIPFILGRRKEEITKNIKGKLSKGESWPVHITAGGQWGRQAIEMIERLALPEYTDGEVKELSYADAVAEEEFDNLPDPALDNNALLPNTFEALRKIYTAEAKAALATVDRDLIPKVSAKATPEQIKEAIAGIRAVVAAAEEIPY